MANWEGEYLGFLSDGNAGKRGLLHVAVSKRQVEGMRANFRAFDKLLLSRVTKLTKKYGNATKERISELSPVDTGFMEEHPEVHFGPKGFTYEAGYYANTFESAGKRFYPPYQEFGTRNHGAQPSVGPAYAEIAPLYRRDIEREIQLSIRRMNRR